MIYRLLLKEWRKTFREYNILFGGMVTDSCLIYVLYLIDMLSIKLYQKGDMRFTIFVFLIFVSLGCWLSCFMFNRYILNSFWQKRKNDYEILDILGISQCQLKRVIALENVILTVIPSALGILTGFLLIYFSGIFGKLAERVSFRVLDLRWPLLSFLLVILMDVLSVFSCFRIHVRKKLREKRYSGLKIILGFVLIAVAEWFILLKQYRVELTMLEIILMICGVGLIFFGIDKQSLKLLKLWKDLYYKKIFEINVFFESCENNAKILFAAFLSDFFILYVVAGIAISGMQVQEVQSDYPYDFIDYGERKAEIPQSMVKNYHELPFLYLPDEFGIIISEKSFVELTGETISLKAYECMEIFQKKEEKNDLSREGRKIFYGNNVELLLVEDRAAIIFGKIQEHGLERIIVVSSDTYRDLESRFQQEYLQFFDAKTQDNSWLTEWEGLIDTRYIVETQQTENEIVVFVFMILGIIILTQIYWIISVRINDNETEMLTRMRLLSILGIYDRNVIKKIKSYSGQVIFISFAVSAFFALQFFVKEYNFGGGGENGLKIFFMFLLAIGVFQYTIYFWIVHRQIYRYKREKGD
ncbi:MAG: hypothetical protein J6D08_15045 [Lachnospiraceae bacterium]|nr:hypothetical protein [Lachnospiraceae bacterium]